MRYKFLLYLLYVYKSIEQHDTRVGIYSLDLPLDNCHVKIQLHVLTNQRPPPPTHPHTQGHTHTLKKPTLRHTRALIQSPHSATLTVPAGGSLRPICNNISLFVLEVQFQHLFTTLQYHSVSIFCKS